MRILRVAQDIYPDKKGGARYHVHALSRDQARMGHEVTVLTTRTDESLPRWEETDGYEIIRLPPWTTILGNDITPTMAKFINNSRDEYDVVHAHSHLHFSTNLAAVMSRLVHLPLAITNHGLYSQSAPKWLFRLYLKVLGRWTFNQADLVFCYTETEKARIRDLGVSSRIEVVPNGVDTERFTPSGPESQITKSNGPVVLFVGRLVRGKQPNVAIEAFSSVLTEFPDASLFVCGDGPLLEQLQQLASTLEISNAVEFLGHVAYEEMPAVYRSSDVLLLPSLDEGVPRTVLEAISSGVPAVTSNLPQLREIVGSNCYQIHEDSPEKYADVIAYILEESDENSRLPVNGEMTWETTVTRTTELLQSMVH